MFGININPVAAADMLFDISGNQARADRAAAETARLNNMSIRAEQKRQFFAEQQWRDQKEMHRTRFQTLKADAEKAGMTVHQALGGAGSVPTGVSIPGQGSRIAPDARTKELGNIMQLSIAKREHAGGEIAQNQIFESSANAAYAHYRFLNEQMRYNEAINKDPERLPNKYDLYNDNTQEAVDHVRRGGFALPAGSSMELPQHIGGYQYYSPFMGGYRYKEEDFPQVDTSIAP